MKEEILKSIVSPMSQSQEFQAAWLGGSRATKREDELSDLDIVIIAPSSAMAFKKFEEIVSKNYQTDKIWAPAFNGNYHQKFYILKDTADTFYLDVVIFEKMDVAEFFNNDRHGEPFVLFDKIQILDKNKVQPKLEKFKIDKDQQIAKFEIMYRTFKKECLRGKFIDAFSFYLRMLAILVETKRVKHTPQKHDFGFRYIYTDFPKEESALLESFFKIDSLESLVENAEKVREDFNKTI